MRLLRVQLRIRTGEQHLACAYHASRRGPHLAAEAGHRRAHPRLLGHPDHAFDDGPRGHRNQPGEIAQRKQRAHGNQHGAPPPAVQNRIAKNEFRVFQQRLHQHRPPTPDGQEHADEEELLRHQEHDGHRDEHAIGEGRKRISQQPAALAGRKLGPRQSRVYPEQMAVDEITQILVGFLPEIGDFEPVGKNVIAVVAD